MLSPNLVVKQWEAAGTQLADALAAFLKSCLALECSSIDSANAKYLSTRMGLRFDFLNTLAAQQLLQSRTSVGRTRNRITPPIHRLPTELLPRVFSFFINGPIGDLCFEDGIKTVYRRVNILGRVCSTWRDIIRSGSEFWSLIPVIADNEGDALAVLDEVTKFCLQRAGRSQNLHLAADLGLDVPPIVQQVLTEDHHRLRTLNLVALDDRSLEDALTCWTSHGAPGSVTELSICLVRKMEDDFDDFGRDHIFPRESPQQAILNKFMEPLYTLRLCGISSHPGAATFNALQELRLDHVKLESKSAPVQELLLAVAPNLRVLHIINSHASLRSANNSDADADESLDLSWSADSNATPIVFPNLQTLYLRDLKWCMIKEVLRLICPGSHRLVLHLTPQTLDDGKLPHDLQSVLRGLNVSELLVGSSVIGISPPDLSTLLQASSTIASLHLDDGWFDKPRLEVLTASSEVDTNFPRLRELHLSCAHINDEEAFKAMVSSHPLERLSLGGYMCDPKSSPDICALNPYGSRKRLQPTDELVTWLQSAVPSFHLDGPTTMAQFFSTGWHYWELW